MGLHPVRDHRWVGIDCVAPLERCDTRVSSLTLSVSRMPAALARPDRSGAELLPSTGRSRLAMWFPGFVETPGDDTSERLDPVSEVILGHAGQVAEPVAVLDDLDGALVAELVRLSHTPRSWCDDLLEERAVPQELRAASPSEAVTGARTVLWRLPKAIGAVDEYAELIARHAAPDVRVIAGGRDKHLSRGMNDALGRSFESVTATLGQRRARALIAQSPGVPIARWPKLARLDALDLDVAAHGATFSTNRLDRGTALLVGCFGSLPEAERAIDLGCGSGIMAALLARQGRIVTAVDVTWSGCDAARRTAEANGLDFEVVRQDGVAGWTPPVGLIVMNPPFHVQSAKDTEPTRALITQARSALVEGGELWCVFNAHLPYLHWLRRAIGPSTIMARDRSYLVTRSVLANQA